MYYILKTRYCIISYVCVARVFVSRPNPYFLRRISVIICRCLRDPLQMVWFLLRMSLLGSYLWAPSRMAVRGVGVVLHTQSVLWESRGRGGYSYNILLIGSNQYAQVENRSRPIELSCVKYSRILMGLLYFLLGI